MWKNSYSSEDPPRKHQLSVVLSCRSLLNGICEEHNHFLLKAIRILYKQFIACRSEVSLVDKGPCVLKAFENPYLWSCPLVEPRATDDTDVSITSNT